MKFGEEIEELNRLLRGRWVSGLWNLDHAERRLTPRCKAIMPVHFAGFPCDMTKVLAFARRHGLKVIEDAAHAMPACREGRLIGSWESDACVFSFYACKPITTRFDGGTETTYFDDVCAGDTLSVTSKLANLEVKESKGLGKMLVTTEESDDGPRKRKRR